MAMSNEESKTKAAKKKPAMAHSAPGTTSTNVCEAIDGSMKKKAPMAHMGHKSTSHEEETLDARPKKKPGMVPMGGNVSAGDASDAI